MQNDSPTSDTTYGNYSGGVNYVSIFLDCRGNPPPGDKSNSIVIVTNNVNVGPQTDLTSKGIILKDGNIHTVRAIYDGDAFNVWLDGIQVITNVWLPGLKMATDSNGYGWVGFGLV